MATKLPTEPISGNVFPVIKGKPGTIVFQNPPFHPNILAVGGANKTINPPGRKDDYNPGAGTKNFHRGVLSAGADIIDGWKDHYQYKVNFLYNPSTIQETRSLDVNNGQLPSYARSTDDPGTYATSLNTTINFSLLFDRTYELWDSKYQDSIAGVFGVRADVEAFYNLMGINYQVPQSQQAGIVAPPFAIDGVANTVVQGPMQFIPAKLIFGNNSLGALSYLGYVSTFDVTYTHFNQQMVPSRCAINVSFTVLPFQRSDTATKKNSG